MTFVTNIKLIEYRVRIFKNAEVNRDWTLRNAPNKRENEVKTPRPVAPVLVFVICILATPIVSVIADRQRLFVHGYRTDELFHFLNILNNMQNIYKLINQSNKRFLGGLSRPSETTARSNGDSHLMSSK